MPIYYCHACASSKGELRNVCSSGPFSSTYQLDKYIKHTVPNSGYSYQSIFDNAATSHYKEAIVNTACAGAVEHDDKGRKNLIYVATTGRIGCSFQNGVFQRQNDTIKVVLTSDPARVHAFTESSREYSTALCADCGASIVF